MIRERTVLILGAGASRDYQMPTAGELRNLIVGCGAAEFLENMHLLQPKHVIQRHHDVDDRTYEQMVRTAGSAVTNLVEEMLADVPGANRAQVRSRINAFQSWFFGSQKYSVDSYLAENPDFMDIGKMFITRILLHCEKLERVQGGWYQELFNQLVADGIQIPSNRLSIITFNYMTGPWRSIFTNAFNHCFHRTTATKLGSWWIEFVLFMFTVTWAHQGRPLVRPP